MIRLPQFMSIRLFVIPTVLLVVAITLIGLVELRKERHNEEVRRVMSSRAYHVLIWFQSKAWSADAKLSRLRDASLVTKEDEATLLSDIQEMARVIEDLHTYYLDDLKEGEEHLEEMKAIGPVRDKILEVQRKIADLSAAGQTGAEKGKAAHEILVALMADVHALSVATEKTHKGEVAQIFRQLAKEEKQSQILLLFVLIGSFALIIALIDSVHHYKSNAERARAAEKTNAIFAAALQNTRVGVLIRDMRKPNRPVVFVNNAFAHITGYCFEDIKGDSSDFLFGWNTDPAAISAFRRAISLRETATLDIQLYRKNGAPFWSEWHLSPLFDERGQLAYFVSLFNDNTIIKQTQEDLKQAKEIAEQASAVKTSFLAMMSHEIRTPINGILGVLKLLSETPLDDEQRHFLSIAKTSSCALHGIINDILDYAKIEAGKVDIYPETFLVREMLTELGEFSQSLIGEKSITITSQIADDVPDRLFADAGRLRQVLLNLISNAVKFTDCGSIAIRVVNMMPSEVGGQKGHLLRFEVQDTGIGISLEDQNKLFQEFSQIEKSYTRRSAGTGLGLAICRRLVQMMNGEIGVESQQGKGSKFWFMVAIQDGGSVPAASLPMARAEISGEGCRHCGNCSILLAEDNDTNRLVAKRYIEKVGFACEEAINGQAALDKAKAKKYDMILMDVSMPIMDGLVATGHIRQTGGHNATVPIIALTAHVMSGDRERCLAAGMNDYLNKPLEYGSLIRMFERWLHVSLEKERKDGAATIADKGRSPASPLPPPTGAVGACAPFATEPYSAAHIVVPVFDEAVLRRMKDDLGENVVVQVTQTFLNDSPKRVEALKSDQIEVVRDEAHTLKSSSASCGLMRFSRLMADLEQAATQGHVGRVSALVPLVGDIYTISRARLEKERAGFVS